MAEEIRNSDSFAQAFRIEKFDLFDERKNEHLFIPRTFAVPTRALAATSEVMPALRKTAVE